MNRLKPLLLLSAYVGKATTQLLLLLAFARAGGAEEAGQFALAVAVCTPVFILSELGLRNVYQTLSDAPPFRSFFLIRVCTAVVAAGVVAVAAWVFSGFPPTAILVPLLAMRAADSILDICYGALQAGGRVGAAAMWMWVNTCTSLVAIIAPLVLGLHPVVSIAGSAACSVLTLAALAPTLVKGPETWIAPKADAKRVLRAGSVLGAATGADALLLYLPTFYLALVADAEAIGIFAVCQYVITLANLCFSAAAQTYLSTMRDTMASGGLRALRPQSLRLARAALALGLGIAVASVMLLPVLAPVVFGNEFDVTWAQALPVSVAVVVLAVEWSTTVVQLVLNNYGARLLGQLVGLACAGVAIAAVSEHPSVTAAGCVLLAGLTGRAVTGVCVLRSSIGRAVRQGNLANA